MPVGKTRGRRRGIKKGVERHKIGSQPFTEESSAETNTCDAHVSLSSAGRKLIKMRVLASQWAGKSFKVTSRLCCALCIVPFIRDKDGRFEVASAWRRSINAMIMALLFVTCVQKLVVNVMALTIMPVGTTATVPSYAGFHLQMTTMGTAVGFVFLPSLSCELFNSWNPTIWQAGCRLGVTCPSPLTYLSSSVQVLSTVGASGVCVFIFPLLQLVFPNVPIYLFPSLKASGLVCITDGGVKE